MRSNKIAYGEQEKSERDWILFHKRRAVLEHRKMWKWIAHAIAVDKENMHSICKYKNDYLTKMILLNEDLKKAVKTEEEKQFYDELITYYRQTIVDADCFCCRFMYQYVYHSQKVKIVSDRSHEECRYLCPVVWERTTLSGTKKTEVYCGASYYGRIEKQAYHKQWRKCCKLAYKIAMLPERSIEDYV